MNPFRYSSLKPLGPDEIRVFGFEEEEDSIRIQHIRRPSDKSTNIPERIEKRRDWQELISRLFQDFSIERQHKGNA
jgi:hypothetical protein